MLEDGAEQSDQTEEISRSKTFRAACSVAFRIMARLLLKLACSGNDQITVGELSGA